MLLFSGERVREVLHFLRAVLFKVGMKRICKFADECVDLFHYAASVFDFIHLQ